jgi:hypothetical protein
MINKRYSKCFEYFPLIPIDIPKDDGQALSRFSLWDLGDYEEALTEEVAYELIIDRDTSAFRASKTIYER